MTFQEIWENLCKKKPLLCNPSATVELESEAFKKLLRQVYEQGQRSVAVVPEKPKSMAEEMFPWLRR